MTLPAPTAPRPVPGVVSRRVGTGGVLVHLGTSHVFELNETGWLVWDGIERGSSLDDIALTLADRYEPEGASIAADIARLVEELRRLGLVA